MIKIKCNYISGAVAIPTEVIDKHLKLAPVASFKVLLFIFRNPDCSADSEQISVCTGLSRQDVEDCLSYWEDAGVITVDSHVDELLKKSAMANAKVADMPKEEVEPKKTVAKVRSLPVKKPTQREIALRIAQEPELTLVYNEAQGILGTFGYDTQALILMIYDYYGFPPEVIITLLQHQKCENKVSSAAIKGRAEDWAKRGIDTLEEVEKELLSLEKINTTYEQIKGEAGLEGSSLSPRVAKYLREWAVNWNCSGELIAYALKESNKTFSDANKLLKKWANSGITTPEEAMEKAKKTLPKEVKKSYDTEKVGKSSVLDWARKFADGEENI
jgi:DNA replication protein DnaD